MKNVGKIVDLIIKEILSPEKADVTEQNVINLLLQSGYAMEEIDSAFHYIIRKIRENEAQAHFVQRIRILSIEEKAKLSPEANRTLLQYYYNNTLSYTDLEDILKQVAEVNKIVDIEDLNYLIQNLVLKCKNSRYMPYRSQIH